MARAVGQPTVREFVEGQAAPLISYGLPYPEACRYHVESTFRCSRVFLLLSGSLAANTDIRGRFQQVLGDKIVGVRAGMKPHTLWSQVVEIVNDTRLLNIDLIITVGAGSLTDAAKVIVWALANDVRSEGDLAKLAHSNSSRYPDLKPPTVKHIAVPSTLSGGEYASFAGATNDETMVKILFRPPVQNPGIVVLDPKVAVTTPSRVFLATGIRALDHCVETLCSLESNEKGDRAASDGVTMLVPALLKYKKDPSDLDAIMQALLGAAESIKTSHYGVEKGGSHAIGHQLGPLGVPHGETSCIMLPAVCEYNALKKANVQRQQDLAQQLMQLPDIQKLLQERILDLAGILDALIRALGLPRTLKDVNIGRNMFDILAKNTLTDMWATTNPVPLVRKEDVLEILEMVAE
jgi:alcohol dehydrogenase class IV